MADTADFIAAHMCCACGGGSRFTACPISDGTPLVAPCRCAAGVTNECPAGSYCLPSGICSLGGVRIVGIPEDEDEVGHWGVPAVGGKRPRGRHLGKDIARMLIGEPEEAKSPKICAIRCLGEPRCSAIAFGVPAGVEGSPSPERLSILSDGRRKGSCALLRASNGRDEPGRDDPKFIPSPRWNVYWPKLEVLSPPPEVVDVPDAARAFSSTSEES